MYYQDPLYGQINIENNQLKLFQTPALTRLRDISLSSVPPLATPSGIIASRFEHSVGVAFLVQNLNTQLKLDNSLNNLYLAALFHDAGSPPFSHASEAFLEAITGKKHEQFVRTILEESENSQTIKTFGGDLNEVLNLIAGVSKPYSDLINGSIDLDNIDNSLRWGLGHGIIQAKLYDPLNLIKAFILKNNQLYLDYNYQVEIQKWDLCRRLVYNAVYSDSNLGPGSILTRALNYAYQFGELKLDFFKLTESQALYILENRSNDITQKLMTDLRKWIFYTLAAEITQIENVTPTFKAICLDWQQSQKIADIIADSLNIPKENVVISASKDKGFKKIHLPFINHDGQGEYQTMQKLYWRIKVYIHPKYVENKEGIQDLLENIIDN